LFGAGWLASAPGARDDGCFGAWRAVETGLHSSGRGGGGSDAFSSSAAGARPSPGAEASGGGKEAGLGRHVASRRGDMGATRRLWLIAALLCVRTQGGAAAFGWGWEGWIRIPAGLGVLFHVPLERNLSAGQRKASAPKTLQLLFFFLLLVNEKLPVREISFGKQEIH